MNSEETLSREYLQSLVQVKKGADHAHHLGGLVKGIMQKIGAAAATGASCYLYEMKNVLADLEARMLSDATQSYRNAQNLLQQHRHHELPLPPTLAPRSITPEDIIQLLKLKCPGCDISYEETWVDIAPATRVLKKGVYISWE